MAKKIFILLVVFVSFTYALQANSILTEYRQHGMEKIKKKMDLELGNVEYWNDFIKDKDTTFGYIEPTLSILTCNKEDSSLKLYKKEENKHYTFTEDYSAFTGKMKGDKVKEGDLKTPLGIYKLTKKISKVDPFYGPMAFVTSYPNTFDKYKGKNGSGIWIHGLPIDQERDEFTKGCIAINNENITELDKEIDHTKTLLIINQTEVQKKVNKEKLASILAQLYKWRYTWLYNETDNYLSFYADDFKRFDGMDLERFKRYKTRIFNKKESKTILFNDITVIPYPNTDDLYQITFNEFYASNSFKFVGEKVLIVRIDQNNNIKIVTEK